MLNPPVAGISISTYGFCAFLARSRNAAGGQLRDEDELAEFEGGREDVFAELGGVVFVTARRFGSRHAGLGKIVPLRNRYGCSHRAPRAKRQ